MNAPPYTMRPMRPTDAPFIFTSWLSWSRKSAKWLRFLSDRIFWDAHAGYRVHVEKLIASSRVLIACDNEYPDFILGYVVVSDAGVHMVYVERSFRKMGVALDLLRAAVDGFGERETVCTTNRPAWAVLAPKFKLRFDPFAGGIAGDKFRTWAGQWRDSCVVEAAHPTER